MNPTPADIFANPDWHLMGIDGEAGLFAPMTRDHFARSSFLDRRVEAAGAPVRVALRPLLDEVADRDILPCGWIFHVAHCGSTLLARLLDTPAGLVLREPPSLRSLGLEAGANRRSSGWADRVRLAAMLSARRYDPAVPTVIKANVPVNFMLTDLAALQPQSSAVMLHFELEPYLLAILHSPHRRAWVDRISDQLAPSLPALAANATIAEKAAALWLGQTRRFAQLNVAWPNAIRLDADRFFANPSGSARLAAEHLTRGAGTIAADADQVMSHYSKNPGRSFDEQDRQRRLTASRLALMDEIAEARRWLACQVAVPDVAAIPALG